MLVPLDRRRSPALLLCHMGDTLLLTYLLCTSILNSGEIHHPRPSLAMYRFLCHCTRSGSLLSLCTKREKSQWTSCTGSWAGSSGPRPRYSRSSRPCYVGLVGTSKAWLITLL